MTYNPRIGNDLYGASSEWTKMLYLSNDTEPTYTPQILGRPFGFYSTPDTQNNPTSTLGLTKTVGDYLSSARLHRYLSYDTALPFGHCNWKPSEMALKALPQILRKIHRRILARQIEIHKTHGPLKRFYRFEGKSLCTSESLAMH